MEDRRTSGIVEDDEILDRDVMSERAKVNVENLKGDETCPTHERLSAVRGPVSGWRSLWDEEGSFLRNLKILSNNWEHEDD